MSATLPVTHSSIFPHVLAPAPRLLMRLALIPQLIEGVEGDVNSFLEIGPGLGDLSVYLASVYPRADGLLMDISSSGIDKVSARVAGNSRLKTQVGDFRTLASGTQYDLLLACEVFEHIEDDESAFRAAAALLKTNGHFIFSVPAFMRNWGPADKYAGHFRRYERAELIAKFKRHGFEIKTIWCYGFPLTQMLYLPYKLYYGWKLARQPLSMEESTKRSGTERTLVNRMAKLPVAKLMWPLFKCQQWVKNTNIGDGYLILARKI